MLYKISKSLDKRALTGIFVSAVIMIFAGCTSSGSSGSASGSFQNTGSEVKVITGLTSSIIDESGAVKIEILGNSNLTYTSLKQLLPLSIVLYFPGTKLSEVEAEYPALGDLVSAIKTSQQDHDSGYDSRVKILLNKDVIYEVSRIANGLELVLSSADLSNDEEVVEISDVEDNYENEIDSISETEVDDEAVVDETEIITEDVVAVDDNEI